MKKEYLFAGISIFMWSTMSTMTKLLLASFSNMQITAILSFFAFITLLFINLFTGKLKYFKEYSFKDYAAFVFLGLCGIFAYRCLLNAGIERMQASQAFIINYLWPVMIVVFAVLFLKEKMTVRKGIALLLSFGGVFLVAGNDLANFNEHTLVGALCCVLAAVAYGLFSVLNKKKNGEPSFCMMIFYFASFAVSTVILIVTKDSFTVTFPQTLGLLWGGVCVEAIAYTCWALALKYGDTAKISNLAYITPCLALVWSFFILKEPFSLSSIGGLALILLGVVIQLKKKKEN